MALNQEYFDSINIDVVKKKYYNANKVNTLLEDIRSQAETINEENALLKAQLQEIYRHKDQISETLLTAQAAARDIVEKAKAQAAQMLTEARQQREEILRGTGDQQEYAAACVERVFDRLRRQQQENIEKLNGLWQEFLCGLGPDAPEKKTALAEDDTGQTVVSDDGIRTEELENVINAIAQELLDITGGVAEPEEKS